MANAMREGARWIVDRALVNRDGCHIATSDRHDHLRETVARHVVQAGVALGFPKTFLEWAASMRVMLCDERGDTYGVVRLATHASWDRLLGLKIDSWWPASGMDDDIEQRIRSRVLRGGNGEGGQVFGNRYNDVKAVNHGVPCDCELCLRAKYGPKAPPQLKIRLEPRGMPIPYVLTAAEEKISTLLNQVITLTAENHALRERVADCEARHLA